MDVYRDFMVSGCKHGIAWMFMDISIFILWDFMGFWQCFTGFLMDLMGFYVFLTPHTRGYRYIIKHDGDAND